MKEKDQGSKLLSFAPRERRRVQLAFSKPSRTKQAFKAECDIHNIIKRAAVTGVMPAGTRQPMFGDFSGVGDYQTALNAVVQAQEAFESLPAHIRDHFANDPQRLLDFLSDSKNREAAVQLGLVNPAAPESDLVKNTKELEKFNKNFAAIAASKEPKGS